MWRGGCLAREDRVVAAVSARLFMSSKFTNRDSFATELNKLVSPSRPIQTIERLFGRERELDRIEKALYADGRHVFIYGDRGVGKSSLAAAAANQWQSSDASYIDASCSHDSTLKSVVVNIVQQAILSNRLDSSVSRTEVATNLKFLQSSTSKETLEVDLHERLHTLPDAVEMLRQAAERHSTRPVAVIDEFNLLAAAERPKFADLLKLLGDKKVKLKLIFTGIGESLSELLGANESAIRQLETIELPKLGYQARMDLCESIAEELGFDIDREYLFRIASISDGYPYYVHLLTEKLMWQVFESGRSGVSNELYEEAIKDAIESISAELKAPYDKVIKQRSQDFEPVLWSTADGDLLSRFLRDMYRSYERIIEQMPENAVLDYDTYADRIRALSGSKTGSILVRDIKPGLYTYKTKMLRGYVRLQAEAHHVTLPGVSNYKPERQYIRAPARADTGYHGPSVPRGVTFAGERKKKTSE